MSQPEILPPLYTQADYQREQATPKQARYRSDFRRDYARILHCPSFRRLQGKTQLFPGIESDFFRNRLMYELNIQSPSLRWLRERRAINGWPWISEWYLLKSPAIIVPI